MHSSIVGSTGFTPAGKRSRRVTEALRGANQRSDLKVGKYHCGVGDVTAEVNSVRSCNGGVGGRYLEAISSNAWTMCNTTTLINEPNVVHK